MREDETSESPPVGEHGSRVIGSERPSYGERDFQASCVQHRYSG